MKLINKLKKALLIPLIGVILATTSFISSNQVFAVPTSTPATETSTNSQNSTSNNTQKTTNTTTTSEQSAEKTEDSNPPTCYSQVGGMAPIICPATAFISKGIDTLYHLIEDFLVIKPISTEENSPVFTIWVYVRNITNIIFMLFLMIVIYSQVTGLGITNYGIKRLLPKLIVSAILVNLSYLFCVLAVDASNIIGKSLYDFLANIAQSAVPADFLAGGQPIDFYSIFSTISAGGIIGSFAVGLSGGPMALLFTIIPVIFSGFIAVATGLLTISLRHAVIILLIAVSPLAFVASLLPNTEGWYRKWQKIFSQMFFFYPLFALLFGASKIAGWIFISSANSTLGVILGLAIQVFPLFFSIKLMKMSDSVLGNISSKLSQIGDKANAKLKTTIDPYKDLARNKHLADSMRKPFIPFSGSSLRAFSHKQQAELKFRMDQAEKTLSGLTNEHLNALRRNSRIVGYDKNDQPIYTQLPFRKSNKFLDAESEAREIGLRNMGDDVRTENALGSLNDYLKENKITKGRATKTATRMGNHYLNYRTALDAKARNDEADDNYYNETVMKAAERDELTGELKDRNAYDRFVKAAAGTAAYDINQLTEEGRKNANQAFVNVIGDAYSRNESYRAGNMKRYESYMSKQVTKEVLRQYDDMLKHHDIDGIIASNHVLGKRGDFDQIAKRLTEYFNSGAVKLGEDSANALAMDLLSMKDLAPSLARFGKFINMETWRYTSGERKTREITAEQYVLGKIEDKYQQQYNENPAYTTKITMATGLEGTRLNGIERTAFGVNDAFTNQINSANGLSAEEIKQRKIAIENAMLPQMISALPTFSSGSEQIRAMVGHMTGLKYDSITGSWKENLKRGTIEGDIDHEVSEWVIDKYLTGLTPNNLINIKTDTWDGLVQRYRLDYAHNHGIDLSQLSENDQAFKDATEFAHDTLRSKLDRQVNRLVDSNMNLDLMKDKVYKVLRLDEKREKFLQQNNQRRNNNQNRNRNRNKKQRS